VSEDERQANLERMLELTDYRRSFVAIAAALQKAALEETTPNQRPAYVTRYLLERRLLIDALAIEALLLGIVGFMAELTGQTPREIYDSYWKGAPTDEWWEERLRERGGGDA
jgi:hypothetical protein